MSIAVRTNTTLAATITQSNLVTALKTALTNAGLSLFDDFTSGTDRIIVYEHINDASATYGKLYLRVKITSGLVVSQQLFTAWNTTTKTGSNGGTEAIYTTAFVSTSSINFAAFNANPEFKMVFMVQGTTLAALGILVPATRPSWWDLNQWSWGFTPTAITFSTWRSTSLNPYANDSYQFLVITSSFLATANPQTNKRDVITGLLLATSSNTGIAGKTSDDLAAVSGSGSSRYDTIQPTGTTQVFTILNNASGGFAVRTT